MLRWAYLVHAFPSRPFLPGDFISLLVQCCTIQYSTVGGNGRTTFISIKAWLSSGYGGEEWTAAAAAAAAAAATDSGQSLERVCCALVHCSAALSFPGCARAQINARQGREQEKKRAAKRTGGRAGRQVDRQAGRQAGRQAERGQPNPRRPMLLCLLLLLVASQWSLAGRWFRPD